MTLQDSVNSECAKLLITGLFQVAAHPTFRTDGACALMGDARVFSATADPGSTLILLCCSMTAIRENESIKRARCSFSLQQALLSNAVYACFRTALRAASASRDRNCPLVGLGIWPAVVTGK